MEGDEQLQKLKAKREELKAARENLVLWKRPFSTISNFLQISFEWAGSQLTSFFSSPLALILTAAGIGLYLFLKQYSEYDIDALLEWIAWWVGLGVLSSIGLGTGFMTNNHLRHALWIAFLVSIHCRSIVCGYTRFLSLSASECGNTYFDVYGPNAFVCTRDGETSQFGPFWSVFFKVWFPAFLWGAGTAIGEIPPFLVSYAAACGADEDSGESFNELLEDIGVSLEDISADGKEKEAVSKYDIVSRMKNWMIIYLKEYGFWAILGFASWPNMAFDLCGIISGHFKMGFWTFFGATFIGKALIKVNFQVMFFVFLFSPTLVNGFIQLLESFSWVPDQIPGEMHNFLDAQSERFRNGAAPESDGDESIFKVVWGYFMLAFIGYFALSLVHSFAQQKQAAKDKKELKALSGTFKK